MKDDEQSFPVMGKYFQEEGELLSALRRRSHPSGGHGQVAIFPLEIILADSVFFFSRKGIMRGISSVGRAIGSQSIGRGFESPILHD